jgi:glycosyltransferase involved in cell wall biosynthesis
VRILKVWDYEYPWDVRIEKVCRALTDLGHEVHLLARNRTHLSLVETLTECTVHRLSPWNWAGNLIDRASQFPAFFNPRWAHHIFSTARRIDAELIIVRDLPLAPTAVLVARQLDVPVILDMAEHYAAMIRDLWQTGTTKFGDAIVRNPRAVDAVERWTLQRVDHTLVVVEESKQRLVSDGVAAEQISIVGNTPPLARTLEFSKCRRAASSRCEASESRTLRLGYIGLMEEARGIRLVIDAVAVARSSGTPVTVDLIGEGRSLPDFKRRAQQLGLGADVVRFHGFLPYNDGLRVLASLDAGLIPHFANESWESTIPNKLFDYMSLGIAVVASDVTPVARVLQETGAGVTFRDRDVDDLAQVMRQMQMNGDRHHMGERGIEAIQTRYHFERDAQVLQEVILRVVST